MGIGNLFADHMQALTQRYEALAAQQGIEQLLVYSGAPKRQFLDDMDYPFKVNPQFKALVPVIDNPFCWVIWEMGKKPVLAFYQPVDFWHLVPETPNTFWTEHFDLKPIKDPDEAKGLINPSLKTAFLGELNSFIEDWPLGERNPDSLVQPISWHRAYKTPYEIACIREANKIAVKGHQAAEAAFRNGGSEFDINIAYMAACQQGENELPYTNIVALNENSAILHYHGTTPIKQAENRSFLIDAGANCNGFASDITRTYSGKDNQFSALITAMDTMQLEIISEMKAGKSYTDSHIECHQKTANILKEFNFINCSAEAAVEQNITGVFFPHGLGHLIGLQVHDVGGHQTGIEGGTTPPPANHPFLRCTRTMEANQVFTIEPGLYVIDTLLNPLKSEAKGKDINWDTVDEFRPFGGIRIEDNVVVTEDGVENLTREFGLG